MKNIGVVLSENFQFLEMKCSIYLNRRVFVMNKRHKDCLLETKNKLQIRKWEYRVLLGLFISSNEICNTAYAL